MGIIDSLQSFFKFLYSKIVTLNLFDTKSTDEATIRRQLLSTRLFLVLFFIGVSIITLYTSLSIYVQTKTINSPRQDEYEKLLESYSDSLQCPCTQISIHYGDFVRTTPVFHQVCSSDFVSQSWIDFAFTSNTTSVWPMDVRRSISAMWQLIAALCRYANYTIFDELDQFANTPLVSSMLLSEYLLRIQTQTTINLTRQTASDDLLRSITAIHQITQASGLLSGLATNFITVWPNGSWSQSTILTTDEIQYVRLGSDTVCFCQSDRSCPMPGNLYLYEPWEAYGLYNLTKIIANETLSGLVVDCLPIQMALSSTLECFYNESCLGILLSAYSKDINISILDKSLSSRFLPETSIEQLVTELFLENITNEIIFKSYYNQCNPPYCTYTVSSRFNILYVITSIIAITGGLQTALHLIIPHLIKFILNLKNKKAEQKKKLPFKTRLGNLFKKLKLSIINLNLFNSHSQDIKRTRIERISTRFYIVFLIITISILILYTFLSMQTITATIQSPSLAMYEELEKQYPDTLKCPCTDISIPYEGIIQITPTYHQLCASDFIQPWWYKQLIIATPDYFLHDFRALASSYFQMLAMFCETANLTFVDANRLFSSTALINSQVLSRKLFSSQTDAIINIFLNSIRVEFTYTLSMINTILHANQYMTGAQTNVVLYALDYALFFGPSSKNPIQVLPFTSGYYGENSSICLCDRDAQCTALAAINNGLIIDGIHEGCFMMDSTFQSSLECWYNETCLKGFQESFLSVGVNISQNISLLNITLNSTFLPTTPFQTITQEIMVDQWNTTVSYEKFYQICRPAYCTYTYEERSSALFIITLTIGFYGGLDVVLRLICPFIATIFRQIIKKIKPIRRSSVHTDDDEETTNQEHRTNHCQKFFPIQIREKLVTLNLFESETDDVNKIHRQRLSSRLYIFLFLICIIIQITYNIISTENKNQTDSLPNQNQYESLRVLYSDTLQCPCTNISIPYKKFLTIDTTFHQACSSDFVDDVWINFLYGTNDEFWAFHITADIRGRGAAYFEFLSTLCELAKTTIKNDIDKFLEETFVNGQILSEEEFFSTMNITLDRFKINTPYRFSRALQLVRDITDGNTFVTMYSLNWDWNVTDTKTNATVPMIAVSPNNSCSCGTRSDCSRSGGIYRVGDNAQLFSILGFNVGCSVVETLLRSTFECFYNQTCIDQLQFFIIDGIFHVNPTRPINVMNSTYTSRFLLNTTINDIARELFIEEWKINISYSSFYQECAPMYCSFTFDEHHDFLYIFTRLLAIYGGLTVALRLITPYLIKLALYIKKRCQPDTFAPNIF